MLSNTLTIAEGLVLATNPIPHDEISFRRLDVGSGYIEWNDFLSNIN